MVFAPQNFNQNNNPNCRKMPQISLFDNYYCLFLDTEMHSSTTWKGIRINEHRFVTPVCKYECVLGKSEHCGSRRLVHTRSHYESSTFIEYACIEMRVVMLLTQLLTVALFALALSLECNGFCTCIFLFAIQSQLSVLDGFIWRSFRLFTQVNSLLQPTVVTAGQTL